MQIPTGYPYSSHRVIHGGMPKVNGNGSCEKPAVGFRGM